jgi:hypothetical protein
MAKVHQQANLLSGKLTDGSCPKMAAWVHEITYTLRKIEAPIFAEIILPFSFDRMLFVQKETVMNSIKVLNASCQMHYNYEFVAIFSSGCYKLL